ncbi:MAG: chondroitinase family polysaccharide lyase [Bacteroides nordii]
MKIKSWILIAVLLCFAMETVKAQVYSFENKKVPEEWSIDGGKLEVSRLKHKEGKQSLKVSWNKNAIVRFTGTEALDVASRSGNGGITAWIYNEVPVTEYMYFSFADKAGTEMCRLPFLMDFKGWRCVWAKFREDMLMQPEAVVASCAIMLPKNVKKGTIYLDYVEFTPTVSWQKMSDAQYKVNQRDYSLIHDFIGYRNTSPDLSTVVVRDENKKGVEVIKDRLTNWYLGDQSADNHPMVKIRKAGEDDFIKKGLKSAEKIHIKYDAQGTAMGEGLFPLYFSKAGVTNVAVFPDINKYILLPLALDYRKNKSEKSLEKALYIYDWFNDQGWADGSGMGTLCFEKLRSAGYFHSLFLLKDNLSEYQLNRELKALKWFTMFGACYQKPKHAGEVADNLRALALPKLIYALSLTDLAEQQAAMAAFSSYMNNALDFGPGFFGTIKADYSGYHHRGPYNSAYYPHALYAASLIAYLLHDTPYALSETSLTHLKQALLTFRFFSANLDIPAGTVGRFPRGQQVLQELLPAFAYVAQAFPETDVELTAAFKRLVHRNPDIIKSFLKEVNSDLTYTNSVGEAEAMVKLLQMDVKEELAPEGSLFMPYSGLLVVKNKDYHINIKGFSKYIWDYESSVSENLYGRYLSYGQIEYFHFGKNTRSFYPANQAFDWNYLSGTTSIVLPVAELGAKKNRHRNFSDETFLCGVSATGQRSMFSVRLHDLKYDDSFHANKSVFVIDNIILCLGSDIRNGDKQHKTVTTLFQSPLAQKLKVDKRKAGVLLNDSSGMLYAVKDCDPVVQKNDSFTVAYIDHAVAPDRAKYQYYIITNGDERQAASLLSENTPIQILRQDNEAHIVKVKDKNVTFGAIFSKDQSFNSLLVKSVNIPLSYIIEGENKDTTKVFFSEPDMRRASGISMGDLSEEDVIDEEKAFETELILNGMYDVYSPVTPLKVQYKDGNTFVRVSTIRGNNYMFNLRKKNL